MGKNYTLYINQPSFEDEPNKSGLVNSLLEHHYGVITVSSSTVAMTADNVAQLKRVRPLSGQLIDAETCKHGADPKFCKKAKPGKVCK